MTRYISAIITFVLLMLSPIVGRAAEPTSSQRQMYENVVMAFVQAAQQNDPAAVRTTLSPNLAKVMTDDVMRPFIKSVLRCGQIQNIECGYIYRGAANVIITGDGASLEMNVMSDGRVITAFTMMGYTDPSGLIVCVSDDTYKDVAQTLANDINADDIDAIENLFSESQQRAMPPAKAAPFFETVHSQIGQISNVTVSRIGLDVAVFLLTGSTGTKDLEFSLNPDGQICFLVIHSGSATDKTAQDKPIDEYLKVARQLVDAINKQQFATIESLYSANVVQQLPVEKTTTYFSAVAQSCGYIGNTDFQGHRGEDTYLALDALQADLTLTLTLDESNHIAWFNLSVAKDKSTGGRAKVTLPELHLKRTGE